MNHHVVIGAGAIGRATAHELVAAGHRVTLVSRTGAPSGMPGVQAVSCDATNRAGLTALAAGAETIINATNPKQYHHWDRDWPPVANAILGAAMDTGAGLVTVANLYPYGVVDAPMKETDALNPNGMKGAVRAQMWNDALAAHQAGKVRATELRASDYFGPGATTSTSFLTGSVLARALKGKSGWLMMGVPNAPHSWTYLPDIGVLAARLATDERSWGRPWHVPTAPPKSFNEVAADVAELTGRPAVKVRPIPKFVMGLARVVPVVRSLDETAHQFEQPFVIDAGLTEQTFGLSSTPWQQALRASLHELDPSVSHV